MWLCEHLLCPCCSSTQRDSGKTGPGLSENVSYMASKPTPLSFLSPRHWPVHGKVLAHFGCEAVFAWSRRESGEKNESGKSGVSREEAVSVGNREGVSREKAAGVSRGKGA